MGRALLGLALSLVAATASAAIDASHTAKPSGPPTHERETRSAPELGEDRLALDAGVPSVTGERVQEFVPPPAGGLQDDEPWVDPVAHGPRPISNVVSPHSVQLRVRLDGIGNDNEEGSERSASSEAALRALANATESAGGRIDGRVADEAREVEEFLRANPPPSRASFERARRIVARRLAKNYDLRAVQIEKLPKDGALLLSNHVTLIDHFMIMVAFDRPVRFIMNKDIFEHFSTLLIPGLKKIHRLPVIGWVARALTAPLDFPIRWYIRSYVIPVLPRKEGGREEDNARSLRIAKALIQRGELVLIFPEGQRTSNGELSRFGNGFMTVAQDLDAPKIPLFLRGVWGSPLSRKIEPAPNDKVWPAEVIVGDPLGEVSVATTRAAINLLSCVGIAAP